jgi:uncharacterized protein (TIGR00369 family)
MDGRATVTVMNETELGARIRESFARQGLMRSLGARLVEVARGRVVIEVPYADTLTQQNGYFHAAVSAAIGDTAGGYAAYTLMDPAEDVLAVEFKINLLRPAVGERLSAEAVVLKEGRTLTICQSTIRAHAGDRATTVAVMMQTNMRMRPV